MTATKTKEFMSDKKVLCKLHHANLVISLLFKINDMLEFYRKFLAAFMSLSYSFVNEFVNVRIGRGLS